MRKDSFMTEIQITLWGTRGSIAVGGEKYMRYGGDTSCVMATIGEKKIFFDAGTGILRAQPHVKDDEELSLLISHPHIDHIIGMTMFHPFFVPKYTINVYGGTYGGLDLRGQLGTMLNPPLWPINMDVFKSSVILHDAGESPFAIDDMQITPMRVNHPGGCTVYRLDYQGIRFVYCLDFEHYPEDVAHLKAFAQDADLMIYDAHFTDEDYIEGWGHSTWQEGVRISQECGVKRLVCCHHHPQRTDEMLERMDASMRRRMPEASFGKSCETIILRK